MGYRSDVAGIIMFKSIEDRDKFVLLVHARGEEDDMYQFNLGKNSDCEWTVDNAKQPIMSFQYDDVKWYESDAEVQAHYDMCRFATETFEAGWLIVQVGEDGQTTNDGDNVHHYDLYEFISVRHTIETQFD